MSLRNYPVCADECRTRRASGLLPGSVGRMRFGRLDRLHGRGWACRRHEETGSTAAAAKLFAADLGGNGQHGTALKVRAEQCYQGRLRNSLRGHTVRCLRSVGIGMACSDALRPRRRHGWSASRARRSQLLGNRIGLSHRFIQAKRQLRRLIFVQGYAVTGPGKGKGELGC